MTAAADQPEFDFDNQLPAGKEWFSINWLARHWGKTPQHISNLVDQGEIAVKVDMRGKHSKRSSLIIPRQAVIDFLNQRKR